MNIKERLLALEAEHQVLWATIGKLLHGTLQLQAAVTTPTILFAARDERVLPESEQVAILEKLKGAHATLSDTCDAVNLMLELKNGPSAIDE